MFENIGRVLKELRFRRRLQQQEVAGKAGVDKGALSRWESGKVSPSLQNLDLLLDTMEVSPSEFLRTCEEVERLDDVERQLDQFNQGLDLRGIGLSLLLEEQIGRLVEMRQRRLDEGADEADLEELTASIERMKKAAEGAAQGALLQVIQELGAEQLRKRRQQDED